VILYAPVPDAAVLRIDESGATGMPPLGPTGFGQRGPVFLPDERHFLFYVAESRGVFVTDLDGAEPKLLLEADAAAQFAAPDTLLFVLDGTLFAQRLDLERLVITGARAPQGTGIAVDRRGSLAAVSASANGTVVFRGSAPDQQRQLVWVGRNGGELGKVGEPDPGLPANVSLDSRGLRAAYNRSVDGNTDIWKREFDETNPSGYESKITRSSSADISPVFSRDGSSLLFARLQGAFEEAPGLFRMPLAGGDEMLLRGSTQVPGIPVDWSADGLRVIYRALDLETGWDLWSAAADGSGESLALARTQSDERAGQLSSDGRWLVFESNQTGRFAIFATRFPEGGTPQRVSSGDGSQPRWTNDDREIVYIDSDGYLTAVRVQMPAGEGELRLGASERLFPARIEATVKGGVSHNYDVTEDGERFLMSQFIEVSDVPLTVLFGFRAP